MKVLCTVILAILFFTTAASAIEIGRVEIEGNIFVSNKKILSIFGLGPGNEYSAGAVSEGVKRLFRSKDFADIVAWYREENGKAVIVLEVAEHFRVKDVRITGNKDVKVEDIRDKVILRAGYFARPSLVTQDVKGIKDLYGEKGYNRAEVKVKQDTIEQEHRVVVSYVITEGKKVKIRHIDIIGNGALESKELRGVMESNEDRWWRGGDYKPSVLEQDLKNIKQLYENEGYLDASVEIVRQEEVDEGKHLDLYIGIEEGPRFYIGDVEWHGNEIIGDEEIASLITAEKGDPYSREEIEIMQLGAINSLYWEKGYIWSRIIPEHTVRRHAIDLDLTIIENEPASIQEIKFSGNTKTFENVIRREFRIYPGDTFILGEVQRSLRDVFLLGYFNGPPRVDTEPVNERGDINLLIDVEEKQTGNFKLGFGFSQLYSVSGFLGVMENNFLGRGKTVSVDWEFGRYRKNVNVRYSEPYLLGTETALTVSVFNWIQDRVQQQYYMDRRKGFSIQLSHPFPYLDYTRIMGSYRFEQVELQNFSTLYPEFGPLREVDWPLNKSSMMLSLTRNSTDSPFHPTRGSISSISAEIAGGPLQGNVEFIRYTTGMSWFRNLFWKFTFHLDMTAGLIDAIGGSERVQDFELFRLGGNRRYALRGYDFYEVVPEGNDPYFGGRFMMTFTQEIIFPFSEQIYGLVFFDAGNTWRSFGEANIFNLRRAVGIGVRIEMPGLGNLGFDYGYGYDKVGGPGWEPHFTFGTFF